ncbi:unnamed protein product [Ilex paraguariensis]|uniref:GATA-type domain-containing protein n=1 Tax=Ilex paraguariensis TaxID=185542 RepID=A0ABC8T594_9AQUA
MEALDTNAGLLVDDDLLNFSLDGEQDDDDKVTKDPCSSSLESSNPDSQYPDDRSRSFPEFEEELEWLSNKDAFPAVETCLDILSDHPGNVPSRHSPVSVLENSTSSSNSNSNGSTVMSCCGSFQVPTRYPVRARTKRRRRRRREFPGMFRQQCWWWNQPSIKKNTKQGSTMLPKPTMTNNTIGRRCQHCQAEKTPQWRAGPMGPKTLCNACGVRYKSGRLVPEYRPASSPTFSSVMHSNSHRKVMEMRKQKQLGLGGMMVNEACGYG